MVFLWIVLRDKILDYIPTNVYSINIDWNRETLSLECNFHGFS